MNGKTRIPLLEAQQMAGEVIALLKNSCERIEVAGSIRRRKPDVGDIEIVCIPDFESTGCDLFGNPLSMANMQLMRVKNLLQDSVFGHRPDKNGHNCCGEGCQRLTYRGFALDIFPCVGTSEYGVIKLIRTGSGDFNKRFVLQRAVGGTILQTGQKIEDGALWDLGQRVSTPEEIDVFNAVGLAYLEPWERQ
jgi:DNA polymerase/3'-5' exonuclease PolX